MRERLQVKCDWTVRALSADLKAAGINVSHDTVWRFLRSEGKTFKKNTGGKRARPPEGGSVAGLRRDSIVAPFVLDGPINGEAFTAWVRQCLVPTLRTGDIVILDNPGSHKGKPARDAVRDVGAHLFFLPPYSPDLNPIEMMFAKLDLAPLN